MATQTIKEILSPEFANPTFWFRPSADAPLDSDTTFTRSSKAFTFDENADLVEVGAGQDRIFGSRQLYLSEGERSQIISSPTSMSSLAQFSVNVTEDAGTAKGRPFDRIVENTEDAFHYVEDDIPDQPTGRPVALSEVVRDAGARYCTLDAVTNDGNGSKTFPNVTFDLQDGTAANVNGSSDITVGDVRSVDVGGGWYWNKFVVIPNSGVSVTKTSLRLRDEPTTAKYAGDGSSGVDVLTFQAEESYYVTTPIIAGVETRKKDDIVFPVGGRSDEEATYFLEFQIASSTLSDFPKFFAGEVSSDQLTTQTGSNFSPWGLDFTDATGPSSVAAPSASVDAYSTVRAAISVSQNDAICAVNGTSATGSYDGRILSEGVEINKFGKAPMLVSEFSFRPKQESASDLEILTSVP